VQDLIVGGWFRCVRCSCWHFTLQVSLALQAGLPRGVTRVVASRVVFGNVSPVPKLAPSAPEPLKYFPTGRLA
jgi:hypothetical protein